MNGAAVAPDTTQPLIAWRAWKLLPHDLGVDVGPSFAHLRGHRLSSYAHFGSSPFWQPGEPIVASCPSSEHEGAAPAEGCSCGIWGFRTLRHLVGTPGAHPLRVLGEVSLWGKVIVTERGFRAQFAYPRKLIVPGANGGQVPRVTRELGSYRVPVESMPLPDIVKMAGLW